MSVYDSFVTLNTNLWLKEIFTTRRSFNWVGMFMYFPFKTNEDMGHKTVNQLEHRNTCSQMEILPLFFKFGARLRKWCHFYRTYLLQLHLWNIHMNGVLKNLSDSRVFSIDKDCFGNFNAKAISSFSWVKKEL